MKIYIKNIKIEYNSLQLHVNYFIRFEDGILHNVEGDICYCPYDLDISINDIKKDIKKRYQGG